MIRHAHIGGLKTRVWLGVVNELPVDIPTGAFFINCYARGLFPSVRTLTLRNSMPVQINALGRIKEKKTSYVDTIDVCNVTENPS